MPTNEERREAACRLREAKTECDSRGYPWMSDDLILAVGYDHDYEAGNEIFDILAELIEPEPERTCKMRRLPMSYICCECGAFVDNHAAFDMIGAPHVNYCPNCGAKVVSYDE